MLPLFALLTPWLLFQGCRSITPTQDFNGGLADVKAENDVGAILPDPRHNYSVYYVRPGDTLYSLGARFGIPWQDIRELNRSDIYDLEIGQVLFIPIATDSPRNGRPHVAGGRRENDQAKPQPEGRPVGGENAAGGDWMWPLRGSLTREYGHRRHGLPEPGVTIRAPAGAEVRAIADGEVIFAIRGPENVEPGWGNVVAVRHGRDVVSWYALLDILSVRGGTMVRKGDVIGTVGVGDKRETAELALRLFKNDRPVNPALYLP